MVDVCKDADVTDLRRSLLKGFGVFQERHFSVSAQLGTPVRTVPGSVVGGVVRSSAVFCWLKLANLLARVKMARKSNFETWGVLLANLLARVKMARKSNFETWGVC
jgi:hypothetical protein